MQVLEFYGLEKQNKWAQLGYESLFFAGFTFLAWAVSASCDFLLPDFSRSTNHLTL